MDQDQKEKVTPLRPKRPCPECGKESLRAHYPFCSKRCKDVDLNRWLSGSYVLPGRPLDQDDDDTD
ncbi:DNA gyrase inhibitor YacG [Nitratireductor aquimarinus]|uniref:DNA gyrase inhibitor YacG n=1 Tax=Nitratireductor aquimarinus TaxID=889300 RepID=A0ABU4AP33_9HYPH|nr:DNA gyrase inhibitor YacG [Nitratireductor aquimarinus]MDV6227989.1 DNA gyrase inhibitor YacG [Nitratireductor aquimarinus]